MMQILANIKRIRDALRYNYFAPFGDESYGKQGRM